MVNVMSNKVTVYLNFITCVVQLHGLLLTDRDTTVYLPYTSITVQSL